MFSSPVDLYFWHAWARVYVRLQMSVDEKEAWFPQDVNVPSAFAPVGLFVMPFMRSK